MNLLVIPNLDKENTLACVRNLRKCIPRDGNALLYQLRYKTQLDEYGDFFSDDNDHLLALADAVVAVGGDGTIIHAAKLAAEAGKPVIGINSGYLGFTAELEPDETDMLRLLLNKSYSIENRMMLKVRVLDAHGSEKLCSNAINDAVISRGTLARVKRLSVTVDGRPALSYRADGLIISTPTGSTAYALSAGGPIIAPQINCIAVTPVCPHDLCSRTVVFSGNSILCATVVDRRDINENCCEKTDTYLTIDGDISCPIECGDRVEIMRSSVSASFIKLKSIGFSETLRTKFNTIV